MGEDCSVGDGPRLDSVRAATGGVNVRMAVIQKLVLAPRRQFLIRFENPIIFCSTVGDAFRYRTSLLHILSAGTQ